MMSDTYFEDRLAALVKQGLYRELTPPHGGLRPSGTTNFSTNDYLGLSTDPRLKSAAINAVEQAGTGATASRLMAGNSAVVEMLEADLAALVGMETALVFGSGFLTNIGVLPSLADRDDVIFSDELNHASIVDGAKLSLARRTIYPHKDMTALEDLLKTSTAIGKKIIVTESLFSMDGDIAPMIDLEALARHHNAILVVDEAHAIGVFGRGGGICRQLQVRPDIVVGTLSKALGSYGGFVACSDAARRFFVNKARSFIFSTGLAPSCVAAGQAAVATITEKPELGEALLTRARQFHADLARTGLEMRDFESQIIPIIVGGNETATNLANGIVQRGIFVRAVRPPTVPTGTARLRLSVTLSMTEESLREAARTIAAVAAQVGAM